MIRLKTLLQESNNSLELAYDRIDGLPVGKLFDDAKRIDGIFKMSTHTWNEVIVAYERYEDEHHIVNINVSDIHITQPNIQSNKVIEMIPNINQSPRINVVQFTDGEMAIYDGHHRLTAHWALGNQQIKVNLVRLPKYDTSGIDTPNDPTM